MLAFLNQVRKPTLDLPLEARRKMWFKPFMQSYLVVFIGYLTMYLIRKNFNIAQNDMISTYGLSMTQLGMIKGQKRQDLFPVGRLDKDTVGLLV